MVLNDIETLDDLIDYWKDKILDESIPDEPDDDRFIVRETIVCLERLRDLEE